MNPFRAIVEALKAWSAKRAEEKSSARVRAEARDAELRRRDEERRKAATRTIGVVLLVAIATAARAEPPKTTTVAVQRDQLLALCGPRLVLDGAVVALDPCLGRVTDLEDAHTADLREIRTLTSTGSPALKVCTIGGLALGAGAGACSGVVEPGTARDICTGITVASLIAGGVCALVEAW